MAKLELKQVAKSFGDTAVIQSLDLTVDDGEFCVLSGPPVAANLPSCV
jgi:ABC-type sugar transport system ATPase subunit